MSHPWRAGAPRGVRGRPRERGSPNAEGRREGRWLERAIQLSLRDGGGGGEELKLLGGGSVPRRERRGCIKRLFQKEHHARHSCPNTGGQAASATHVLGIETVSKSDSAGGRNHLRAWRMRHRSMSRMLMPRGV